MKEKPRGRHIPTKDEDPGIVANGVKTASKFKKPLAKIDKYVSKGDKVE